MQLGRGVARLGCYNPLSFFSLQIAPPVTPFVSQPSALPGGTPPPQIFLARIRPGSTDCAPASCLYSEPYKNLSSAPSLPYTLYANFNSRSQSADLPRIARHPRLSGLQDASQAHARSVCPEMPIAYLPARLSHS